MVKRIPNRTFCVDCVGRRHIEISKTEEGNLMFTIVLVRRMNRSELAHLIVPPEEFEGFKEALTALT